MNRQPAGVRIEVRAVRGSAPREAGAAMLVTDSGTEGSLGGGALEHGAIGRARTRLRSWRNATIADAEFVETHALGPALAQCCGGSVTLAYRPWFEPMLEKPTPLFHLQLHGGGHVGRALVTILQTLPCTIDWIESRMDGFPEPDAVENRIATIRRRYLADPASAVAAMPAGAFALVMTHSHALDFDICAAILRRDDTRFTGLIGSHTKHVRFMRRWRALGISDRAIDRLTCPIGLPVIGGKRPSIIAVAVAAQLLVIAGDGAVEPIHRQEADDAAGCGSCASRSLCATS